MTDPATISLDGLNKAAVLAALYNASQSQGFGFMHYTPKPMTIAEAQSLLDSRPKPYFDYVKGRVLKIDLTTNTLDPWGYNRDNGANAAEQVIAALRTQEMTP